MSMMKRLPEMLFASLRAACVALGLSATLATTAVAQDPALFADPERFELQIYEVALCKSVTDYRISCPTTPGFTASPNTMRCADPVTIARGSAQFDLASVPPGGEAGKVSGLQNEIPAGSYRYIQFVVSRNLLMQGRVPQPGAGQDCITKRNGVVGTDENGLALYDTEGSLVATGAGTPGLSTDYFEIQGICSRESQRLYTGLYPLNSERFVLIVEAPKEIVLQPGGSLPRIRVVVNAAGTLYGSKDQTPQGLPIGAASPVPTWGCSMALFDPIEQQFSVEID